MTVHLNAAIHITRNKNITASPNKNIGLCTDCYISVWCANLGRKIDAGVDCVRRQKDHVEGYVSTSVQFPT